MTNPSRGILQLDFDGTLAEGDVSVGILAHFLEPSWQERIEAAGRELVDNPESTALVDAMVAGYAELPGDRKAYIRFARKQHPVRAGLAELIDTALRLGLECHVVSNGFEFYIRDYLRAAGVEDRVEVHSGSEGSDGTLEYLAPDGEPTRRCFKQAWAEHFLDRHHLLVYVGDGSSDVPPARLAGTVFARDGLLTSMSPTFTGTLLPFESLHDVEEGLRALLDSR